MRGRSPRYRKKERGERGEIRPPPARSGTLRGRRSLPRSPTSLFGRRTFGSPNVITAAPDAQRVVTASAPGKCILLGEHAVVYGEPAIALALSLRTRVTINQGGSQHVVNGQPLSAQYHSYVKAALDASWAGGPLELTLESGVPSACGLGSSAALTVATVKALAELSGGADEGEIARRAFETELAVQQGRASPTDTSTATHGGAIYLDNVPRDGVLWSFERDGRRWAIHGLDVPPFPVVLGNVGRRAPTGEMVAKAAEFVQRSAFGKDVVRELGQLTREGKTAMLAGDVPRLGSCMNRAHRLLTIMGISTPELNGLVEACQRRAHGAKLTGAGGGGCMLALTDAPEEVAEIVRSKGATPYVVQAAAAGVRVE